MDTLLYLSLDLITLLSRSRVGPLTYFVTNALKFQLEVYPDQLITRGWRG